MVAHIAVAAENLDGVVGHFQHHFVGVLFGEEGGFTGVLFAVIAVGRFPDQETGGFDFDAHVGEHKGDALAVGDRFTKGGALFGIGQRILIGRTGLTNCQGSQGNPTDGQEAAEANALDASQAVGDGDAYLVQGKRIDAKGFDPHQHRSLADGDARCGGRNNKGLGDTIFLGIDQELFGFCRQRDIGFLSVDEVAVALLYGCCRQVGGVELIDRLDQGGGGAGKVFIAKLGQIGGFLLRRPPERHRQGKEIGGEQVERDADIAPAQFLQVEGAGQGRVLAKAAIGRFDAAGEQAQLPAGLHQFGRDGVLLFGFAKTGTQLFFSKAMNGFHQHLLFWCHVK